VRLRQVALVAADLDPVVDDLGAVLGIEVGFRDPGIIEFGLANAVMPVGDTFLEVVAPVQEGTTAGRYLERRGGDGGYMVILQTDRLDADRQRFADLGVRVVWSIDLEDMWGTHLHPRDVGGAILSVDAAVPAEEWRWAGPAWRSSVRTDVVTGISGVVVQADEPDKIARRWSEVLDVPVGPDGVMALDGGGRIRFVAATDGRGDGVSAVEVTGDAPALRRRAADRGRLDAGGRVLIGGVEIIPV
jgi:hypothetical protein